MKWLLQLLRRAAAWWAAEEFGAAEAYWRSRDERVYAWIAAGQERGRRLAVRQLAASVKPPIAEEGDDLESVEAKRAALVRLFLSLHAPGRGAS